MLLTHTVHPPRGATALIAVIGSDSIHNLGYFYALIPVTLGAFILLLVAVIIIIFQQKENTPLDGSKLLLLNQESEVFL